MSENKLKVLELFGGIGACSKALERLGIDFEIVDYVEIDNYAVKSYNAIHDTSFDTQDICEWDKNINVDLIMHGSPCQDFSLAGKQAGGDVGSGTRSSLMYETIRIVGKLRPKYVIWENVKNLLSKKHKHNFDAYLETMKCLGYTNYYQVLNAKDYGIPQNRERVFTVSILGNDNYEFPLKNKLEKMPIDYLEENPDKKYDLTESNIKTYDREFGSKGKKINLLEPIPTLTASMGTGGGNIPYFEFPPKEELKLRLKDMLEDSVDEKYYLSNEKINSIARWKAYQKPFEKVQGKNSIVPTLTARGAGEEHSGMITYSEKLEDTTNLQEQIMVLGNYMPSGHEASRIVDSEGLAPTVKENHGTVTATTHNLRIRKLTPKECWRLMGFDDEDFDKASQVNSNTQLYKQAGNSIVVNVLERILENLLK